MIMVKTPLRASFCGGGSDMESFYKNHGGAVISAALNKYVYLSIHPSFSEEKTILKYSAIECVTDVTEIKHKIIREALKDFRIKGVEIDSQADVPAGTGLGSSSTFTVALLHLLYAYSSKYVSKEKLAAKACEMEIEKLGEPIGKQDQYAAAYGGLNHYAFNKDGSVSVEPIMMERGKRRELQENLMMFYTGGTRSASKILEVQSKNISHGAQEKNLLKIMELTEYLKSRLEQGDIDALGRVLDENWKLKKSLAAGISNEQVDDCYSRAIEAGALGGKLLGAGGGGFLMFYVKPEKHGDVRNALSELKYMKFGIDWQGSQIIYIGDRIKWE